MTARTMVGRIPIHVTNPAARSGPATAPRLSPARSSPKARPYAERGVKDDSRVSREGPRMPRDTQASARNTPACHTAPTRPMAPVASAVPRYPPEAKRPRCSGVSASGPPTSFATPMSASEMPSTIPSAPAEARSTEVKKLGSTAVVIS